jgi:hypothetical protein
MSPSSPEPRIPLSDAQQRLWFLHQLEGTSGEYHVPEGFLLRGELDRDALRRALDALVARHESLRTRFPTQGGSGRSGSVRSTSRPARSCGRGSSASAPARTASS